MTPLRLMLVATVVLLALTPTTGVAWSASADKILTITSEPTGASVELNGTLVGVTPFTQRYKDYFFNGHGNFTFSDYLKIPISITVSKDGYVAKTTPITRGPLEWFNVNRSVRHVYYYIPNANVHVRLEKVGDFLGANPLAESSTVTPGSVEELIAQVLPSVVTVRSGRRSGSGFLVIESGVVVTNKHVVEGEQTVSVMTSKGVTYQSRALFLHPSRDLALIKIEGGSPFPFLRLADPAQVKVGADVVAFGSPGLGTEVLPNTVTRGIVSAFRNFPEEGLVLQTDASINSGNSGGPLVNSSGEAVGVNTFKGLGKESLAFAVFCSEVLSMLKDHFGYTPPPVSKLSPVATRSSRVPVDFKSDPDGADILVDGTYVGSTPSKIAIAAGEHLIKFTRAGFVTWERRITVEEGSTLTISAVLVKGIPTTLPEAITMRRFYQRAALADARRGSLGSFSRRVPFRVSLK